MCVCAHATRFLSSAFSQPPQAASLSRRPPSACPCCSATIFRDVLLESSATLASCQCEMRSIPLLPPSALQNRDPESAQSDLSPRCLGMGCTKVRRADSVLLLGTHGLQGVDVFSFFGLAETPMQYQEQTGHGCMPLRGEDMFGQKPSISSHP